MTPPRRTGYTASGPMDFGKSWESPKARRKIWRAGARSCVTSQIAASKACGRAAKSKAKEIVAAEGAEAPDGR
jgi:hypothetical protein